jgi:uncharacterized repeat protein (TIGR02543 family)
LLDYFIRINFQSYHLFWRQVNMISKNRLASLVVSMAVLILLSCTGQESPFKAQDAKINLVVENSLNRLSSDAVTDTVGNQVRIGMNAYLPSYISLVTVTVTGGVPDPDVITFRNVSAWNDTQWIDLAFDSTGTKTVTVVVSRQGAPDLTYTANIIIVGRNVNHKPALSVSGVRNIVSAAACSLSLSATDADAGQTFTYAMIKGPQGATLTSSIFRWTAPTAFTGTDTATFTVTDNGKPPMSDTQTVLITVSSQIVAPVKVLGVKAVSKVNGYFVLSWNKVSNADSYNIFRAIDTINFQKIGSTSDSLFGDSVKSGNYYYYVVAVNTAGTSPASAMVYSGSIKTPPVIMVPTVDTSVAQGKTLSFMVQAIASAQDTVVLNATDIAGGKLPDSAVFNAKTGIFTWTPTYGELGLYSVVFTATNGNAVAKDTVKIAVTKTDRPPVVQAQSVNASRNLAITIALVANDPDGDSITQWQITQKPHSGTATLADSAKGNIVYTPNTDFVGVDTFAVRAYDGSLWSQASANVIVSVSSIKVAPKIQTQPRPDTTVSQGGSVTFTVAINNASPSPTFIWYQGTKGTGTMKDSSTNPLYQKTGVTAPDSGNYYVIVVNSSGADTSAYAHLNVNVPPPAPALSSPVNNATGIAVSPTLTWNAVTGAITYRVQVSTASDFSTGIVIDDSTLASASKGLSSLTNNTVYYWHVNAKNAGGTSAWSTASSFTTIAAAPGAPVLSAPANNATGIAVSPTVTWNTVTGAVTYRVQVSTVSDFSTGIVADDSTLTAASKALSSLTNNTLYYWRVNAKNAGGTSAWSTAFSFTTIVAAPGAPVLSAPANNATGVAVSQAVSWGAVTGAATYRVQVSTAVDFSIGIVVDDSTLTTASKALNSLTNNTMYYWRVNAKNAGGTSAWSAAFNFTTIVATSGVPSPLSPANSATGVPVNPTLTWSTVTGAATYRVQVSTAADFSTGIVVDDSTLTTASKALNSLTNNTVYYWRVDAKNAGGTSAWSTSSSFTTIVAAPGVPALSAPANNATGIAVSPTVTWNAVTGAATYRVQVSTASDFSTGIVVDDSTLTAASKAVGTLSNGTKYYWRVNAKNAGGTSTWASFSFTTIVKFSLSTTATNGTVTPNPAGSPYDSGTVVALTPVANPGYRFTGWSGDLAGTASPGSITMNSAKNVTANFAIVTYALTISATNGSVTKSPNSALYDSGTVVTLTPVPATGYQFSGWNGDLTGTANPGSITLNGTRNITANFTQITYQLTVTAGANGSITAPSTSPVAVNYGAQTTITASPTAGYKFVNWTVTAGTGATIASPTSASTTVSLTAGPATLTANFQALACSWTEVYDGSGLNNYAYSVAANGNTIFVGTKNMGGVRSTDNGTTWNPAGIEATQGSTTFGGTYIYALAALDGIVLAGNYGWSYPAGIFYSSNNGNSWTSYLSGTDIHCFAKSGSTLYAGTGNGTYLSTDSGISWSADFANTLAGVTINALLVNGSTIYATTGSAVYYRTTGGYYWTSTSTGLPSSGASSLVLCAGTMFAGTSSGVYKYDDNSGSWSAVNTGLPSGVNVNALTVSGSSILAGTAANGVYLSIDNGASWSGVNSGLPGGSNVVALAVNSTNVFAVSGYGLYSSLLP